MENQSRALILNQLSKRIRSFTVDKAKLKKILELLQERSYAAGEIEVSNFQKGTQTDEEFEKNKTSCKEGFKLFITLKSKDGKELSGSIEDIFSSPNYPDSVTSVFFDSSTPLKVNHNYIPRNSMILFLDFTSPAVFNFNLMPSFETPNNSNFTAKGYDATWVNGVFNEFNQMLEDNKTSFSWLHRHTIYDVLVWLVGLPFAFWTCFKLSSLISKLLVTNFLHNAIYVYLFFLSLTLLRVLFHYARWIWPLLEYKGEKDKPWLHRLFWSAIILGLVSAVVWDSIKYICH